MKRFATVAVLLATLAAPSLSRAANFDYTGSITVGNPLEGDVYGVSDFVGLCDPSAPTQGVDGYWIVLDSADIGKAATLKVTDGATGEEDVDAIFYNEDCTTQVDTWLEVGDEAGTIPDGAYAVVVNLFIGAQADFTLSVSR